MRTSWHKSGKWYNKLVGKTGHYYHQHTIIPQVLRLLDLKSNSSLIDLGCGNGVLAQKIPETVTYVGLDSAADLISVARQQDSNSHHRYYQLDATKPYKIEGKNFTHAVAMLSLQNMEFPDNALKNLSHHLAPQAKLVIVLNHPCFRIPRQSEWGIDAKNKLQYRRLNRYLSPLKIPLLTHPGQKHSPTTWSFHYSLSDYFSFLHQAGFVVEQLEEWTSDKTSGGAAARMENLARQEFPLFLTLICRHTTT